MRTPTTHIPEDITASACVFQGRISHATGACAPRERRSISTAMLRVLIIEYFAKNLIMMIS
jgi:hypothetical protein